MRPLTPNTIAKRVGSWPDDSVPVLFTWVKLGCWPDMGFCYMGVQQAEWPQVYLSAFGGMRQGGELAGFQNAALGMVMSASCRQVVWMSQVLLQCVVCAWEQDMTHVLQPWQQVLYAWWLLVCDPPPWLV